MEVRLEQLNVRFGEKTIFSDFSLQLPARTHLLVTGDSGSGKSTLLKLLMGFCIPDSGRILINGTPLTEKSVWQLRRRIAYVPQRLPAVQGTARALLESLHRFSANQSISLEERDVLAYFERFGLHARQLDQPVGELSGGEQQRLAIISALLLNRDLILLDEATSALDADRRSQVMEYLSGLQSKTMLIVAHDKGWPAHRSLNLSQPVPNG